jgi:hypothetical protein
MEDFRLIIAFQRSEDETERPEAERSVAIRVGIWFSAVSGGAERTGSGGEASFTARVFSYRLFAG